MRTKSAIVKMSEHDEQCSLMVWWALIHNSYKVEEHLLFAIPNGGDRDVRVGQRLKHEGVRPGIPDLFLAVPRGRYAGLFIEMKRAYGGRTSPEQRAMLDLLIDRGYCAVVCAGCAEARQTIEDYLKMGK